MITSAVLNLVVICCNAFDSLLPHVTFPSWLSGSTVLPSSVAHSLGGILAAVAPFLPVDDILTVLTSVFALWPAILAYIVFSWVWRHTPTIAGFGTGDG